MIFKGSDKVKICRRSKYFCHGKLEVEVLRKREFFRTGRVVIDTVSIDFVLQLDNLQLVYSEDFYDLPLAKQDILVEWEFKNKLIAEALNYDRNNKNEK